MEDRFNDVEANRVPRRDNEAVDALAKMASRRTTVPPGFFVTGRFDPTVRYGETHRKDRQLSGNGQSTPEPITVIEDRDSLVGSVDYWRAPYIGFLSNDTLLENEIEARRLHRRAKSFVLIGKDLYK